MRLRLAACLLAILPLSGCLTIADVSMGQPIDKQAVATIRVGTPLQDVLDALGAPLEVHDHVDGRLLVYRHRLQHTVRLDLSLSRALQFIDLTQVLSELANNVSLTLQRTHSAEDRVVILFNDDYTVRAVAFRPATENVPAF